VHLSVDNEMCSGHARCADVDPDLFTLDDVGYSNIGQGKEVPAAKEPEARRGVDVCPERALSIEE